MHLLEPHKPRTPQGAAACGAQLICNCAGDRVVTIIRKHMRGRITLNVGRVVTKVPAVPERVLVGIRGNVETRLRKLEEACVGALL